MNNSAYPPQDLPQIETADATSLRLLLLAGAASDRRLLEQYLGQSLRIEACVGKLGDLRQALKEAHSDAVLLWQGEEAPSVTASLRTLREIDAAMPLLVLVAAQDQRALERALKNGAQAALSLDQLNQLKPCLIAEVRAARRLAACRDELQQLRQSEALLRALANNLPGMVFHLQRDDAAGDFRFVFVSAAAQTLLGVKPDDLLTSAKRFIDAFEPEERTRLTTALEQPTFFGKTMLWQGRLRSRGRSRQRWLALNATAHPLGAGGVIWQGVITDATASKNSEAELRAAREHSAKISSHLEAAREEERERIARDIHDELGSILVRLKIEAALLGRRAPQSQDLLAEKFDGLVALIDQAIGTAQRVTRQLRPGILKEFGLADALHQLAEDFAHSTGVACRAQCEAIEALDSETALALFRIVQEALTNVAKHAHASQAMVRLQVENGSIVLEVRDDGQGIVDADLVKPRSFGLRGIRERVTSLFGNFSIGQAERGGALLQLNVPLRRVVDSGSEETKQPRLF